ncbi:MAG: SDR family oxidoreductase [Planctomycetota bacterium]|nr:SDR family oxidoreductase [Planctomycetota bacterium]
MEDLNLVFGTPRPVALITGSGAPRIGNCIARTLFAHGYRVVLHARESIADAHTTADELDAGGSDTLVLSGDLTDESEAHAVVDGARDHFGRLDVLVNCAAIWHSRPLEETTAQDLRDHFDANAVASFLCAQRAGLIMSGQSHGGAIINLGDWATLRPYLGYAAYFPSKGAIPTMTRSLAVELSRRNSRIRVNAVLPGPAMLPGTLSQTEHDKAIQATLLQKAGRPEDIANAVTFLAQSTFITGVSLPVDGGRSIGSQ